MRYLLDTSTCVEILQGHLAPVHRLGAVGPDAVAISAMTVAELRYGVMRGKSLPAAHQRLGEFLAVLEVLEFDGAAAEQHARARHTLASLGTPIGERDLVIAATAIVHSLVVVTGNIGEYRRVLGLAVDNWA